MASRWDEIKGRWTQLKGKARARWGELTDDEWDVIAGDREQLIGALQQRYGWSREEAEQRVETFVAEIDVDELRWTSP
jgi:uncharacterized protein YjbJ (UPF0337 family)